MKKIIALLLTLTCIFGMAGCRRSMNNVIGKEPEFVGIVAEVLEDSIIVNIDSSEAEYDNCPVVMVPLDVEIKDSHLACSVGDEIVVYYNGRIIDGEPRLVEKVYAITLKTPANREQNAVAPENYMDEVAGNMTFYKDPVEEAQNSSGTVSVQLIIDLDNEQANSIKAILDGIDKWVDDHLVDRSEYYYDGDFQLSDREHTYYFTYEHNVIYYDHYFAEISQEDMQYIMNLSVECIELPDVEPAN